MNEYWVNAQVGDVVESTDAKEARHVGAVGPEYASPPGAVQKEGPTRSSDPMIAG